MVRSCKGIHKSLHLQLGYFRPNYVRLVVTKMFTEEKVAVVSRPTLICQSLKKSIIQFEMPNTFFYCARDLKTNSWVTQRLSSLPGRSLQVQMLKSLGNF